VCRSLPNGFDEVAATLQEIDVVWATAGANRIEALFEVEHSTPVYSGLLRFNDLLLTAPNLSRFSIVSNDTRRAVFSRQVHRPTFRRSGLSEIVSFLEYPNVYDWHERIVRRGHTEGQDHVPHPGELSDTP
jgi:type II restriction enzyme